jgi:nucleotide-binding universal stress UspA family protein
MSEIKSILLHLDASARSAARLRLAAELAERHEATVTAAYAATPAAMVAASAIGEGSGIFLAAANKLDEEYKRTARQIFDDAQAGPRVSWAELADGMPRPTFVQEAFTHDLLVLGQYDRSDSGGRIVPADFAESVVIESGKPAIVVPCFGDFAQIGRTVLVAWKRTREAARALAAALPLLRTAQRVHVAAWGDEPRDIERLLLRHGIAPTFHAEPAAKGDTVGELMGCYGHSRARELVLGGMSRTVMDSMTLPVLMAH